MPILPPPRFPRLYPQQKAAVCDPARYSYIEASTKSGKTAGCLTWILGRAWNRGFPGRNSWWIAPVYSQAKALGYERLKRMLASSDPRKLSWNENASDLWIELANGARIYFKGSDKPDSLYGEDVYDVVIDEASRCKEEAWYAIRSVITATKGRVRAIGNVRGRRNWFYRGARMAEAGEPDYAYHKLTAQDAIAAGIFDPGELEDAKRSLPPDIFRELYYAEPSDEGGNPFGLSAIAACTLDKLAEGAPVAYGVDLAKSVDWTVICGLDAAGRVCHLERFRLDWGATRRQVIAAIGNVPAYCDSTGVGDPIVEDMQRVCPQVSGFKFTGGAAGSKQQLMLGLASAIQQQEVLFPAGWLCHELESFEFQYSPTAGVRYNAPGSQHDDGVDALALAVKCRRELGAFGLEARVISTSPYEAVDEDHWTNW